MLYLALFTLILCLIELIIRRKENEILEKGLEQYDYMKGRINFLQREIKDNEVLKIKVYKDLDDQIDKLKEELEKEQKAHKNTKQYKYRAERARKERDVLKKQNETLEKEKAELQEFMVFTNKWVSEAHSILKKDYKNSQVKCISFKKFIEKYLKEGHELFR